MKTQAKYLGLVLVLAAAMSSVVMAYSGGAGTAASPYQISCAADWQELMARSGDWGKQFIVTADIDLAGVVVTPVGTNSTTFSGILDGSGHTIYRAVISQSGRDYAGLFGRIAAAGQVKNLGVAGGSVTGANYCGGLAGESRGTITGCYVTVPVTSSYYSGGLVGENRGTITGCYATGDITSSGRCVGGLVGQNYQSKVIRCYSAGKPTGSASIGGLCGAVTKGGNFEDTGNFWDTETSKLTTSVMGTGKTTSQMKTQSTFTSGGWDFSTVWFMPYNSYPHLLWDKYSGGSGTETDPYRIGSAGDVYDMMGLSKDWGTYFILTADIDLGGAVFGKALIAPDINLSSSGFQGTAFTGVFNGNGFIIYHFTIECGTADCIGLFGGIDTGAMIQKLGVEDCTITGTTGSYYAGVLAGYHRGSISACYATGSITGTCNSVGGLAGWVDSGSVDQCYSACAVSGAGNVGGLVGIKSGTGLITRSFWDVQVSGQAFSAGGTGKTTAGMKTVATFIAAGWDFTNEMMNGTHDIWRLCVDGASYPQLNWQAAGGDFACPDGVAIEDLQHLAAWWLMEYCEAFNACSGADMDLSGTVDLTDYAIFTGQWMEGI